MATELSGLDESKSRDHHEELIQALHACAEEARDGQLKLDTLFQRLGHDTFGFICIVHTLPFLQPLSLGPISTAAGISLTAIGWQMMSGHKTPWLPQRMREIELSGKFWRVLLSTAEKTLRVGRKISRPRLNYFVNGPQARKLAGFTIASGGILLAVPFAGVPFSNTLPALAVLVTCFGELEEDGGMALAGIIFLILTVAYFALIVWLLAAGISLGFEKLS